MARTYKRQRWIVKKTGKEHILYKEELFEGEKEPHIEEVLRNYNDIVVLSGPKFYSNGQMFSSGFLSKNEMVYGNYIYHVIQDILI